MAQYIHPDVHDNGLVEIQTNAERCVVVSATTSSYANVAANTLADVALAGGDFTIANGDVSGRKITCQAKSTTVSAEGDPVEILWVDDTNNRILMRTDETTSQTIYAGNPLNIPAIKYESQNP